MCKCNEDDDSECKKDKMKVVRLRKVKKSLPQLGGFVRVVLTKLTQKEIDWWTSPKTSARKESTSAPKESTSNDSTVTSDGSDSEEESPFPRRRSRVTYICSSSGSGSSDSSDSESAGSSTRRKSRKPSKRQKTEALDDEHWCTKWDKRVQPVRIAKKNPPIIIDSDSDDDVSSSSTVIVGNNFSKGSTNFDWASPVRETVKAPEASPVRETVKAPKEPRSSSNTVVDGKANSAAAADQAPKVPDFSTNLNDEICTFIDVSPSSSETSPPPVVTQPPPVVTQPPPVVTQPRPVVTQPPTIVTQPPPVVTQPRSVVTQPPPVVTQRRPVVTQPRPVVSQTETASCSADNKDESKIGKIRLRSLQSLGVSESFIKEAMLNLAANVNAEINHEEAASSEAGRTSSSTSKDTQKFSDIFVVYMVPSIKSEFDQIAVKLSLKLDLTETFNQVLQEFGYQNRTRPDDVVNEELEDIVKQRQECDLFISNKFQSAFEYFAVKLSDRKEFPLLPSLLVLSFLNILFSFVKITKYLYKRSTLFKNLILVFTESLRNGGFNNEQIVTFLLSNKFQYKCFSLIQSISEVNGNNHLLDIISSSSLLGRKPIPVRNISFKMSGEKMVIEYSKTLEEVETKSVIVSARDNKSSLSDGNRSQAKSGEAAKHSNRRHLQSDQMERDHSGGQAESDSASIPPEALRDSLSSAMRNLTSKDVSFFPVLNNQTSVICSSHPNNFQAENTRFSLENASSRAPATAPSQTNVVNPVKRKSRDTSIHGVFKSSRRKISNSTNNHPENRSYIRVSNISSASSSQSLQSEGSSSNRRESNPSQSRLTLPAERGTVCHSNAGVSYASPKVMPPPRNPSGSKSLSLRNLLVSGSSNVRPRQANPTATSTSSNSSHLRPDIPVHGNPSFQSSLNNGASNSTTLNFFIPTTTTNSFNNAVSNPLQERSAIPDRRNKSNSLSVGASKSSQARSRDQRAPVQVVHPIVMSTQTASQQVPRSSPNTTAVTNHSYMDTMDGGKTFNTKQCNPLFSSEINGYSENRGTLEESDPLSCANPAWNQVEDSYQSATSVNSRQGIQSNSSQKQLVSHQLLNDYVENNYSVNPMTMPQSASVSPVVPPNEYYQNQQNQYLTQNSRPQETLASSNLYSSVSNGLTPGANPDANNAQYQSLQNNAPNNSAMFNFNSVQTYSNDSLTVNNSFGNNGMSNENVMYNNNRGSNSMFICEPVPNIPNQNSNQLYVDYPQSGSYQSIVHSFVSNQSIIHNNPRSAPPNQIRTHSSSLNQPFNPSVIHPGSVNQGAPVQGNSYFTSASTIHWVSPGNSFTSQNTVQPAAPNQINYQNYQPNS